MSSYIIRYNTLMVSLEIMSIGERLLSLPDVPFGQYWMSWLAGPVIPQSIPAAVSGGHGSPNPKNQHKNNIV